MSQTYTNFDRQRIDDRDTAQKRLAGGMGIAMIAGGVVFLLAAAGGAYYVGTLNSSAPAPRTVGTFGSWEARCATPPGRTAQICTAVLQVVNNQNKNVLMSWIVGPDDKGALQTVFQTPTGVMIGNGVDVKVDNAAVRKISFQACGPQQCTATGPMNDAFIKEISGADKANITLTAANGQALNFGIPVGGFDKALAAINPPASRPARSWP